MHNNKNIRLSKVCVNLKYFAHYRGKSKLKETKKTATKTVAKEEETKKVPTKKSAETAKKAPVNAYKDKARVYHISKNDDDKWQVKLASGEKAIKLFNTQKEAIDYAKSLVDTQGGSYRIHSLKGKIRK